MDILSYFYPFSTEHHGLEQWSRLSWPARIATLGVTTLFTVITFPILGLGGVAAFRIMTKMLDPQSAAGRTHTIAQERFADSKENEIENLIRLQKEGFLDEASFQQLKELLQEEQEGEVRVEVGDLNQLREAVLPILNRIKERSEKLKPIIVEEDDPEPPKPSSKEDEWMKEEGLIENLDHLESPKQPAQPTSPETQVIVREDDSPVEEPAKPDLKEDEWMKEEGLIFNLDNLESPKQPAEPTLPEIQSEIKPSEEKPKIKARPKKVVPVQREIVLHPIDEQVRKILVNSIDNTAQKMKLNIIDDDHLSAFVENCSQCFYQDLRIFFEKMPFDEKLISMKFLFDDETFHKIIKTSFSEKTLAKSAKNTSTINLDEEQKALLKQGLFGLRRKLFIVGLSDDLDNRNLQNLLKTIREASLDSYSTNEKNELISLIIDPIYRKLELEIKHHWRLEEEIFKLKERIKKPENEIDIEYLKTEIEKLEAVIKERNPKKPLAPGSFARLNGYIKFFDSEGIIIGKKDPSEYMLAVSFSGESDDESDEEDVKEVPTSVDHASLEYHKTSMDYLRKAAALYSLNEFDAKHVKYDSVFREMLIQLKKLVGDIDIKHPLYIPLKTEFQKLVINKPKSEIGLNSLPQRELELEIKDLYDKLAEKLGETALEYLRADGRPHNNPNADQEFTEEMGRLIGMGFSDMEINRIIRGMEVEERDRIMADLNGRQNSFRNWLQNQNF